ncbi:hypothetical protein [Kosakonia pseudosacchari]|uniref:Uncharacterized protein n=1 Tax=Kosakonia pseudosacchari TaxID=1646340 RepID=A0ABX4IP73_9ENTR|nr:hypothetical protein [Kosakonia pseudosacchari]PDO85554.1 hypothetical protein BK796_13695 [Kosakonia pseudosacchari]
MMKYITRSLALSRVIAKKIATNDPQQLELIKDRLKSRFGVPVGMHMTGIPLGISMILAIFCYAMPQVSLWMIIFNWLSIPEYKVLIGVFFAAAVYCVLIMATMLLTVRGSLAGFKAHLLIIGLTGAGAILYFVSSFFSLLFGAADNYTPQITSVLGLIFFLLNVKWINSSLFYRSIALSLHNRVWRKQLKIEARQAQMLKR